jgi:phosphatidylinositol glycan class V
MNSKQRTSTVFIYGLLSRLLVWTLGVLAACFVQPYDSSGMLAYYLLKKPNSTISLDYIVKKLVSPFANWDGIYFLRISEKGYEFEQFHAFFPLYPLCIRLVKEGLKHSLNNLTKGDEFNGTVVFSVCIVVEIYIERRSVESA